MTETQFMIAIVICVFVAVVTILWFVQSTAKQQMEKSKEGFTDERAHQFKSMWLQVNPAQLASYKLISVCVGAGFIFGMMTLGQSPLLARVVAAIIIGFYCYYVPDRYYKKKYNKWLDRINEQLIDGLSILANALRSGMSFNQALDVLTREMEDPIAVQFRQVTQDVRLGKEMDEALQELAERVPLEDIQIMVTAIIIVRKSGGNLAEVFESLSLTVRDRFKIQGKINSLTSTGRLQAIIVCALPFFIAAAIYVIDSGLIEVMWQTWPGCIATGFMFFWQWIGYKIIVKICTIDI
ncbi:type II secretion system F family protein [Candidatus Sumerlaeota bacterium]|nr:type II secretion system F family protein [Candidatus Sumerlaeota bacterium]